MMAAFNWPYLFFTIVLVVQEVVSEDPLVHTKLGPVKGYVLSSFHGRNFFAFSGVPFAKPPVGPLRFKPPLPIDGWNEVYDATKESERCMQLDMLHHYELLGSEDCLYLNVYSPKLPKEGDNPKLDVMVWIHGGAFMWGTGSKSMYGPEYIMDRDVVLVTIQYRLASLGFFSTGDDSCPGNLGLKDQNMALRWVKEHVEAFGGNSDSITILGLSAGGASVHYHVLSPMSRGLFHRAISHSGSALCSWSYLEPEEAVSRSKRLAALVGCTSESSKELMKCMASKDPKEIVKNQIVFQEFEMDPITAFGPTLEKGGHPKFLPEEPYQLIYNGKFTPVPYITGMTANEGAYGSSVVMGDPELVKRMQDNYLEVFPISLDYKHLTLSPDAISKKIRKFYFGDKDIGLETVKNMTDMYSDRYFDHGIYETARMHAEADLSPVYWYRFTYRGKFSLSENLGKSEIDFGVCHADDLQYLFKSEGFYLFKEGEQPEQQICENFLNLWTNFAKTGNPTPKGHEVDGVTWQELKPQDMIYLDIGPKLKMKKEYPHERMAFWSSLPLQDSGKGRISVVHEEL